MRQREWLVAVALATLLFACSDDEETKKSTPGAVGDPCILDIEEEPDFSGFPIGMTYAGRTTPEVCESEVCFANHFQGRVSCPYGQTEEQAASDPACFLPGSNEPVTVPVDPQLLARSPAMAMTCSCQCGAPPEGCECPTGTVCASLSSEFTLPMYCMIEGAVYDPTQPPSPDVCDESSMNCGDARPYPPR